MEVVVSVRVAAPPDTVWDVATDIDSAPERISGIDSVEVVERPDEGLVGLKWRETRTLFGKSAEETMWITGAEAPRWYDVEARSHGSAYHTRIALEPDGDGTRLSMTFRATPENLLAKILTPLLGSMMKGATRKALQQDLEEIRAAAEAGA